MEIKIVELKVFGVNDSCGFDSHSFRKTGRITMVGLLALEARGCRFESCLSDERIKSSLLEFDFQLVQTGKTKSILSLRRK